MRFRGFRQDRPLWHPQQLSATWHNLNPGARQAIQITLNSDSRPHGCTIQAKFMNAEPTGKRLTAERLMAGRLWTTRLSTDLPTNPSPEQFIKKTRNFKKRKSASQDKNVHLSTKHVYSGSILVLFHTRIHDRELVGRSAFTPTVVGLQGAPSLRLTKCGVAQTPPDPHLARLGLLTQTSRWPT